MTRDNPILNRRSIVKGLTAFVAAAAIPETQVEAFVSEAKATVAVDVPALEPGLYTFSVYVRHPGANWVRIERSFEHVSYGPIKINLLEMVENADRVVTENIGTSGPSPSHTQVRFLQLETVIDEDRAALGGTDDAR